jgi:hypothetical protein
MPSRSRSSSLVLLLSSFALALGSFHALAEPDPQTEPKKKPAKARKPQQDDGGSTEPGDGDTKSAPKKVDMSEVSSDEAAEKKCMKDIGEGFKMKHTRHFAILYNTSEADLQIFSSAIERTYRSCLNYCSKAGIPIQLPKHKLIIHYFEEFDQYDKHSQKIGTGKMSQSTPGFYVPKLNLSYFYNFRNQDSFKKARKDAEDKIAALKGKGKLTPEERRQITNSQRMANASSVQGGDVNESTVQHEVAHQVLWNIGFHNPDTTGNCNPRWFAEGTAMMFEPISAGGSANFGALNKERLKEFQDLEQKQKTIPLREFLGSSQFFEGPLIGDAYAEAWGLAHYLNRVKRKELIRYVALINKRPKGFESTPEKELKTFEKAFGPVNDRWVNQWKEWLKNVH